MLLYHIELQGNIPINFRELNSSDIAEVTSKDNYYMISNITKRNSLKCL